MKEFSVIIEKDEDGYFVASVPALRGWGKALGTEGLGDVHQYIS